MKSLTNGDGIVLMKVDKPSGEINMRWQVVRGACFVVTLIGTAAPACAQCGLFDWLFGRGHTTYAAPYCPPAVAAPSCAPACGPCAPACVPACQPCAPTTTYRIAYRPVPTVAYMPLAGVDPCSGCPVTTYRPTRAWTYQASLVPYTNYRMAYSFPAMPTCATCPSPCGTCSSRSMPGTGCSSCSVGMTGGEVSSGGCSSCTAPSLPTSGAPLPGPADMSAPSIPASPSNAPPGPAIGPPASVPGGSSPSEPTRTFTPGSNGAPISPSAPTGTSMGGLPAGTAERFRTPVAEEGTRVLDPVRIQNVPPVINGPRLNAAPPAHPEGENRTTSRGVQQAMYVQLLPAASKEVPARVIRHSPPAAAAPSNDDGWGHVE